jgi:hypothetical protein
MSQHHNSEILWLTLLRRAFCHLARHKVLAVVTVGFVTLGIRAALIPLVGIPEPAYHDEFSYLLAADTFAHGRLANPTHPMWVHFETFHVIQQPTYSSMYAPAQGLVLGAGQLLGHPWIGQWLITGLMCSVLCWMLQGWLPPKWALYGAILAVLHIGVLRYWMNGYWSSSVVAFGGALVLGALPRIKKHRRVRDAILMGLGLAILANSRPYEGFILSLTVAWALLLWMATPGRPDFKIILTRVVAPLAIVLVVAAVTTGYFYYRVTTSPFRMTYQIDSIVYNPTPYFLWQRPLPEPAYHHEAIRAFYEHELAQFWEHRSLSGFLHYQLLRSAENWSFYLGSLLTVSLIALPWTFRDRRMHFSLLASGVFLVALAVENWSLIHYAAPATALVFLIVTQCFRHLSTWKCKGLQIGRFFVWAIPLLLLAVLVLRVTAASTQPHIEKRWPQGNLQRAAIVRRFAGLPGKHLILVHYGAQHDLKLEWVYNAANIDDSKIVWARDMGDKDNQELLRYFHDRQTWSLEVDDISPPKLSPYTNKESPN